MESFPPTLVEQIDAAIQQGIGAGASVVGQTYDVRRLDPMTNGSISSNTPIFTGFPCTLSKTTKLYVENEFFTLVAFIADCNRLNLQLMDELTETGYGAMENGVYVVAQKRPLGPTIVMRADMACTITRPMPTAGQASAMPASGFVEQTGSSAPEKSTEQILTLTDGLYAFSNPPIVTPATVQCQIQPTHYVRDGGLLNVPTEFYREKFYIYVPDLPGEQLDERDRINFSNSGQTTDRYVIMSLLNTEQTGLSGYIIVAEKMGA
jgi:hypothetical protein